MHSITQADHLINTQPFQDKGIKISMLLAVMHPLATIQARHAVPLQGYFSGLQAGHTGGDACATSNNCFRV
jgi:hypothetical protein